MSDIISIFIGQAEQIKTTKPEIWNQQFENDLSKLHVIANNYMMDPTDAMGEFNKLKLSVYPSFGEYIKSQSISAIGYKFTTTAKQTKRKKKCFNCGCMNFEYSDGGIYKCKNCGTTIIKKQISQLIDKANIDESKHIMKQLNSISGKLLNPPAHINKVLPYVKRWFLDRSYLKAWLEYSGRMENFKEKYYEMPLQNQVLLPNATDEAKKAFEIYKEKALIVNKMAFLGE